MLLTGILVMGGGMVILTRPIPPRDRRLRNSLQGLGAVLFTGGLPDFMYMLLKPSA
jgi:hypothetical protein